MQNGKRKWGYINKTGKLVIPYKFDDASDFSDGLASVRLKKNWGYINQTGKFVIKPIFTYAGKFSENVAAVKIGGKLFSNEDFSESDFESNTPETWKYIDKNGKTVIKLGENVQSADSFSEGLAIVSIKGDEIHYEYVGYIDKTGTFVIKTQFVQAFSFSDGLAKVSFPGGGKFNFIDKTGRLIMSFDYPSEYAMVNNVENGLISVQKGGENFKNFQEAKYGYIDKTGKVIWQPTN